MFCSECGTKNKDDDNFCTECGHRIFHEYEEGVKKEDSDKPAVVQKDQKTKKSNLVRIIVGIGIIALAAVSYRSAQYYADYKTVESQIDSATTLNSEYKYTEALEVLENLENSDIWKPSWLGQDLVNLKESADIGQDSSKKFVEADVLRNEGRFEEAREKLQEIPVTYGAYEDVKEALTEVQVELEQKLKDEAEAMTKEAEDAKSEAEASAARADANAAAARRAEQERAAANAAASAAARDADEAAAEAAGRERAEAFIDETVSIYNSLITAEDYVNLAIENSFDDVDTYIYYYNNANAVLMDVQERASAFYDYRTIDGYEDIPVWLYGAAAEYLDALDYLSDAQIDYFDGDMNSAQRNVDKGDDAMEDGRYYRGLIGDWLTDVGR